MMEGNRYLMEKERYIHRCDGGSERDVLESVRESWWRVREIGGGDIDVMEGDREGGNVIGGYR